MEALCVQYERVADMRVEDFGDDDELTRPGLHAVKRPAFKARRHRCYTRRFDHPAWRQDEIGTDCFVNLRRCVEARYVHRLAVILVDQVHDELARLQYVGGSILEVPLPMGKEPERDRQSVVSVKGVTVRVDLGGRRIIKNKK